MITRRRLPVDAWPGVFGNFFERLNDKIVHSEAQPAQENSLRPVPIRLWRLHGDEIVFVTELEDEGQLYTQVRRFYEAITKLDTDYRDRHGLGVKGTCWTAGFPLRNYTIGLASYDLRIAHSELLSMEDHSPSRPSAVRVVDYIGLEMDMGFRLAALGCPGRLICSIDVAYLLARSMRSEQTGRFFIVSWSILKGIYQERPLPIIWMDFEREKGEKRPRTIFEEAESEASRTYLRTDCELGRQEMLDFCRKFYEEMKKDDVAIEPYIKGSEMNEEHRQIHGMSGKPEASGD